MAANIDDIKLKLAVETAGAEGISALAKDLSALAKEGGDAAPEFQRLANEFQKIAEQAKLVQEFSAVSKELADLSARMGEASGRADKLKLELEQQAQAVDASKQAYRGAQSAVRETTAELQKLRTEQATLRATTDAAGKDTNAYRQEMSRLRTEVEAATTKLSEQKEAQAQAKAAMEDASAALSKAGKAYNAAASEAKSLAKDTAAAGRAAENVQAAMQAAGVEAKDLATAQQQVATAMNRSRVETSYAVDQFEQARVAAQQLAAEQRRAAEAAQFQAEAERRAAEVAYSAIFDQVAAREKAAAERKRLAAEEQAEFERLYQIEQSTRAKMQAAAQQQLVAEKQAFLDAAAAEEALIQRRTAAYMSMSEKVKRSLAEAFSATGIRSEAAIRAEIGNINESLIKLATTAGVTGKDFDRAFASAQIRLKELDAELTKIPGKLTMADQAAGLLKSQMALLAATFGAFEIGRGFIEANVQMESLRRALALITGSTQTAATQIQFLQDISNRTGQKIGDLSEAFIKLQASAKASNIPLSVTNGVFQATANAAGQLGLSSSRTGLILEALGQIANKGTVSMEELRQQIGDSLPGALSIAAKGLGITEQELTKLVESGNLMARDFFPAFQKGLVETFGAGEQKIEGFRQSWARFTNTLQATYQFIGDSGVMKALTVVLEQAGFAVRGLVGAFELLGKIIGITFGAIATFDFASPIASIQAWRTAVQEAAVEIQRSMDRANSTTTAGAQGVADAQGKAAAAIQGTANAASGAQASTQALAAAQTAAAGAAGANADAQKKAGDAATTSANAARNATGVWVQLQVAYTKVNDLVEKAAVVANKLAEAKKLEMDASIALAQMVGNETTVKAQAAQMSEQAAAASREYAAAKQTEVDVLKAQLAASKAVYEAEGQVDKAREEAIKKLEESIKAKQADAEVAKQKAAAAQQEALANKVAAETYKDNALRLNELKKAHEESLVALKKVAVEQALGKATQEQLTSATQNAAKAEALYNDALKDTAAAADRKISALQRVATQTQASLAVEQARIRTNQLYTETLMEQAKADEAAAIRSGDMAKAVEAQIFQKDLEIRKVRETIEAKELELKVVRAKIEATNAEAKAILAAAEAEKAQLEATGALTEAKKAEIEARIASAKLKQTEAELLSENIRQINEEIDALRQKKRAAAEEAYQAEEGKTAEIAKRMENVGAINAETAAIQRKNGVDKEGFATDSSGNRLVAGGDSRLSIYNTLKGYGLSEEAAMRISGEFADENGNVPIVGNRGMATYGQQFDTISMAILRAAQKELFSVKMGGSIKKTTDAASPTTSTPAATGTTVNINVAGFRRSVNVASEKDAQTIVEVLESAFGRSA